MGRKEPDPDEVLEGVIVSKDETVVVTFGNFPHGATGYDPETRMYTWDEPS